MSEYLEAQNELDKLAGVALKRIQHFYYKTDVVYGAMRKLALQQQQDSADAAAAAAAASPALDAEIVDGDEAEGATGKRGTRRPVSLISGVEAVLFFPRIGCFVTTSVQ